MLWSFEPGFLKQICILDTWKEQAPEPCSTVPFVTAHLWVAKQQSRAEAMLLLWTS